MGLNILFLQHQGVLTRDVFFDIIEGYRQAGHNGLVLELAPIVNKREALSTQEQRTAYTRQVGDEVKALATEKRIDLCVCMWGNGPAAFDHYDERNFFDAIGLPIVMHWLDAPQWAHQGEVLDFPSWAFNGPCSYHFINNAGTAQEMEAIMGFSNIITSSNAANPDTFRPRPVDRKDFDIVFGITDDTKPRPLMLRELVKDEPDVQAIRADVAASLRNELLDVIRPLEDMQGVADAFVDRAIEVRLANRHAPVLEQIAGIAHAQPDFSQGILALIKDAKRYVASSRLLRRMESWERALTFVYLSRYFKCATFGFGPSFQQWPGEWAYLGPLEYKDQSLAYSRSRFGLNVMRWQDDLGLNLKPFEITLSGTCLLQAYRVGIEDHFTDAEAVAFNTPQECREKVADLLTHPDRIEQIARVGRERSLRHHCWKHRAAAVIGALDLTRRNAQTSRPSAPSSGNRPSQDADSGLVFLLGQWRSGTTLLRKILDSHTLVHAPAETWFLLPLLDLWEAKYAGQDSTPRQAAAAIQSHVDHERFLTCCRAFALRFYQQAMPASARYFVDKTPFYLKLADLLPSLFPRAKFIVLSRDPRGTVWSRHTWKHIESKDPTGHFEDVAHSCRTIDRFLMQQADRSVHVDYETLCADPEPIVRKVCEFLALPFEREMIDYGHHPHHEGWGDEKTLEHDKPHVEAVERWAGDGGLTVEQQGDLATQCGQDVLHRLGYSRFAELVSTPQVS
ncbi:MAG: sulfotransferase [Phycisphaerales bacterium]|nr:MAG: sulfotransferase [Phycisphaerales bacterium]